MKWEVETVVAVWVIISCLLPLFSAFQSDCLAVLGISHAHYSDVFD